MAARPAQHREGFQIHRPEAMVSCCSMAFVTCPVLIAGRALIGNHVFLRVVMRAATRSVESISVNYGHGRKFSPRRGLPRSAREPGIAAGALVDKPAACWDPLQ